MEDKKNWFKPARNVLSSGILIDNVTYRDNKGIYMPILFNLLLKSVNDASNPVALTEDIELLEKVSMPYIRDDDILRTKSYNWIVYGKNHKKEVINDNPLVKKMERKRKEFYDMRIKAGVDVKKAIVEADLNARLWFARARLAEIVSLLDRMGLYLDRRASVWMIDPVDLDEIASEVIKKEKLKEVPKEIKEEYEDDNKDTEQN